MLNARKASLPNTTVIGTPKKTLTAICYHTEGGEWESEGMWFSLACCVPWRQRHTGKIELRRMNLLSLHSSYYHLQGHPLTAYHVRKMTVSTAFLRILQHRIWLHMVDQKWFKVKPKPHDCSSETVLYSGSYILKVALLPLHIHGIQQLLLFSLSNSNIESLIPSLRIFVITIW